MATPITYLFVPGNRPERFDKALDSRAGAIILDLEDAVSVAEKGRARDAIANWFPTRTAHAQRIVVRINDAQSPWFEADLALLGDLGLRFVMLPKTEWRGQLDHVRGRIHPQARILPLIETARGVNNANEIALSESVQRLAFGTLDYAVDLDLAGDEAGLIYPSSRIAIASRCADLAPPIAGVTPVIDDEAKLRADCAFARGFGFGAKLCIHPKQVDAIHASFRPTPEELAWAARVLAAAAQAEGAVQLDGKMIDRPVVLRAEAILARGAS